MVFRMELTYNEIEKILDIKHIDASTTRYTLPPGIYEISDNLSMLRNLFPNEVKVIIRFDDNRLKSNLTTDKTIGFTKRSFFFTKLGFTQSHSGPLGVIEGSEQLIPGSYKSDKPINITATDKVRSKCNSINGSIARTNFV